MHNALTACKDVVVGLPSADRQLRHALWLESFWAHRAQITDFACVMQTAALLAGSTLFRNL